ncbi:MAG: phosphoribosylformimino-5-aminoimidazole carboxamide ribotide isomerase [Acidimicrobiaceae bacterium]|jgi:phosphoribosylformimino-5-aminoimidazole carboxamide ribotide isomerase|nr:phosphoribosylformimino-5-aminoimidazole carboxamide ribotide isomerase [Acidimicrobiaceae bacterium]
MDLYPAIDIRDGGAVRLTQGDFNRQTDYGDPVALAEAFAAGGAPWLHVVDLDAARSGEPVNRDTVLAIAKAVGIPVETGGGIRSQADVTELLEGGLARVILGTAILDDPDVVRLSAARFPGQVAVGLDYRLGPDGRAEIAIRGWEEGSGRTVVEVLDELSRVELAAVIVTAIERDGTLRGPDLDGLAAVLAATGLPVIASGGVGSAADLSALARISVEVDGRSRRLAGAITGKALVDGRMTVEEAMAACALSV